MPPSSSIVTKARYGMGRSMISSITCCSGMSCAFACAVICASTGRSRRRRCESAPAHSARKPAAQKGTRRWWMPSNSGELL